MKISIFITLMSINAAFASAPEVPPVQNPYYGPGYWEGYYEGAPQPGTPHAPPAPKTPKAPMAPPIIMPQVNMPPINTQPPIIVIAPEKPWEITEDDKYIKY